MDNQLPKAKAEPAPQASAASPFTGTSPALARESGWRQGLLGLLVVVGGLLLLFGVLNGVATIAARHIPDDWEVSVFADVARQHVGDRQDKQVEIDATPEVTQARRVFERLLKFRQLRQLEYRLVFDESKTPNAFAVPGGTVVVTKGLFDLVTSDVGLAMVLGHELGHHQRRHVLRSASRRLGLALVQAFVFGGGNLLTSSVFGLADNAYSRDQELEADTFGLKLVARIFGTTDGALEFFQSIEKDQGGTDSQLLTMFSSHPCTPERIAHLRQLMSQLKIGAAH